MLVGAALLLLLRALGSIPDSFFDLIVRAAPALLVLFGLSVFLRSRVPFGSIVALLVTAGVVALVINSAFATRAAQERTENTVPISEAIPPETTLVRVAVQMLDTTVRVESSTQTGVISGQFVGSTESRIEVTLNTQPDTTADLIVRETRSSQLPMLEAMGRGTLLLQIPANLAVDVSYRGGSGDVTMDMDGLALERLNVNVTRGNVIVTLPEYDPLGSPPEASLGTLSSGSGDLTVIIPESVGGYFELNRGGSGQQPDYDALFYNYLVGDILEARNIESAAIVQRYTLTAAGSIRVEVRDG